MLQRFAETGKLRAAFIHFLVTLIVGLVCGALVFFVWYQWPFYRMLGGVELFLLVVGSDLVLGPLITLVIYSKKKNKSELLRDYAVVAVVQISALIYGMHTVMDVRPVFMVYAVDGFDVVVANDLKNEDLVQAKAPEWRQRSWTGPIFVWAPLPEDAKERTELSFQALAGKDIQVQPRYFRRLMDGKEYILSRAKGMGDLAAAHPEQALVIARAVESSGMKQENLIWAPVRSFREIWTVVLNKENLQPVAWLAFDPY